MAPRVQRIGYWLLVLCACAMTALLFVTVTNAMVRANRAEQAREDLAERATARISKLNARITYLSWQVQQSSEETGELNAAIRALGEQVRQQGGEPVVVLSDSQTRPENPSPRPSPTTTPPPPTTTTSPPPTTTTTTSTVRPCVLGVADVCINAAAVDASAAPIEGETDVSVATILAVCLLIVIVAAVVMRRLDPLIAVACGVLTVLLWLMIDGRLVA